MRVARGSIVALGYGKYVRAERIVGLEPIEDGRGPGRRTRVWVEYVPEPMIASRSETAILADAVEGAEEPGRSDAQRRLLVELLETVDHLDPVLRRIVRDQASWDLDRLEARIRRTLGLDSSSEAD
ncbi:MAG: hypothetical protein ACREM1_11795 [Longimicrobiales bacterium]